MLYVQQSLNPDEEILMGARFHWMYTLQAVFWILFGLAAATMIGYAGVWWEVDNTIKIEYPGLPEEHYDAAWRDIVVKKGGYLKIIWNLHIIMRVSILVSFVMGVFFFAHMMIAKATTEIAVTTERLVYKKGLIARHVGEINVDRIEGVSVRQGAMARIFGYGIVCIRGMGVGEVALPPIEAPVEFRRAVTEAKMIHEKKAAAKASGAAG
jgi:hypothetical protein